MPWARASSLHRHLACPSASWLPRHDRGSWEPGYLSKGVLRVYGRDELPEVPARDTSAADWGTALHDAKAELPGAADPWLAEMAPHRDRLWPPGLGVHERCLAWDCRRRVAISGPSGVTREQGDAWKAAQSRDCVVGVADWAATLSGGEPWVDDLKTGWRRPDPAEPQRLFYLMCLSELSGGISGWVSATWWPRGGTGPTRDGLWRHVGVMAFEALKDEIDRAWKSAVGPSRADPDWRPNPRPGTHCMYCPSAAVCDRANE